MSISKALSELNNRRVELVDNLNSFGIEANQSEPLSELIPKVLEISGGNGDWRRPVDRPSVPVIGENEIYLLFGVQSDMPNNYALLMQTNATTTNYQVDWGDGSASTTYTRNTKSQQVYNFATIDKPVSSEGVKWVWIKVSAVGPGYFTIFNIMQRPDGWPTQGSTSIYRPQVYEIYMRSATITNFGGSSSARYSYYSHMNIFDYKGPNACSSMQYLFNGCTNLHYFNIELKGITNFGTFLNNAISLKGIGDYTQPLDMSECSGTFAGFLTGCVNWRQQIINTGAITSFASFFVDMLWYNTPIVVDTSSATSVASAFTLPNYEGTLDLDLASLTTAPTTAFIGNGCPKLTGVRFRNMTTIVAIIAVQSTRMNAVALELLISDLVDRTGLSAGTCSLQGNWGTPYISQTAIDLAELKNWTLGL